MTKTFLTIGAIGTTAGIITASYDFHVGDPVGAIFLLIATTVFFCGAIRLAVVYRGGRNSAWRHSLAIRIWKLTTLSNCVCAAAILFCAGVGVFAARTHHPFLAMLDFALAGMNIWAQWRVRRNRKLRAQQWEIFHRELERWKSQKDERTTG